MRRILVILACVWVAVNSFAAVYTTCQPTDFRSTSVYMTSNQSSAVSRQPSSYTQHQSLTAISASNFATLNGEGGACYIPSATKGGVRKAKIDEPETEAVGEGVWQSPVGDTPWLLIVLLLLTYLIHHIYISHIQKKAS